MSHPPEQAESLWFLIASPVIWSAHFLLSYITAAIWCAKVGGSLEEVRIAIAVYTVAALLGIGAVGWKGFRRHHMGTSTLPHDFDSAEDRHRFIGFASLLLSLLSGVATIYVALAAVFNESCI